MSEFSIPSHKGGWRSLASKMIAILVPKGIRNVFLNSRITLRKMVDLDDLREEAHKNGMLLSSSGEAVELVRDVGFFVTWFETRCTIVAEEERGETVLSFSFERHSKLVVILLIGFCFFIFAYSWSGWGLVLGLLSANIVNLIISPFWLFERNYREKVVRTIDGMDGRS